VVTLSDPCARLPIDTFSPQSLTSEAAARRACVIRFFSILAVATVCCLAVPEPASSQSTPADPVKTDVPAAGSDQPAEPEQIDDGEAEPEAISEPPLSETEQWAQRFELLLDGMDKGEKEPTDADALYMELAPILQERRQKLRIALVWARSPIAVISVGKQTPETSQGEAGVEAEQTPEVPAAMPQPQPITVKNLHAILTALYGTRIGLLQHVTPEFRAGVTGAGLTGVRELNGEIEQLILHVRFQVLSIPQEFANATNILRRAPLPIIGHTLELILALVVFFWWRRWAASGLAKARRKLLDARPRRRRNLQIAKFLWYVDRVRSPLEWLVLLAVFFSVVDLPIQDELEKAPWIAAQWVLLAWFAVAFINAMAARGIAGLSGETAALRLRSLQLVAAWLVLLGLGLDLAVEYTGRGTIYAWFWMLFEILTLPVLILLIALWRSEIIRQLENEPKNPAWVRNALQHKRGPRSYVSAAVASPYLITVRLQQQFLRAISGLEWGKRLQASLYKRELTREKARLGALGGTPISAELRDQLLLGKGQIIDKVARGELARLVELVEEGRGGVAVIVAERGCGKSLMLQRLAAKFEHQALVFDCPPDGYEAFETAFARALGLSEDKASSGEIAGGLKKLGTRLVGIDNLHRLVRPVKGGQQGLDRLYKLLREVGGRMLWVGTIDKLTWQFLNSVRADRAMTPAMIELPLWTGEQIGGLIDHRCRDADITPDFGQLVLPRHDDDAGQETLAERNRLAFHHLLWDAADGNPAIALRLWADSLAVTEDGNFIVHLPSPSATSEIEKLTPTQLLVLRVIAQSELIARDEIVENLRFSESNVGNAILVSLQQGWIKEVDGRYRLSWDWYRTITRVLVRRNFLYR
jgi:hypothetical protein